MKYVSLTDTAKLIRKDLKSQVPGTTFSVRSYRYAGGASIRIEWTDGPARSAVEAITDFYPNRGSLDQFDHAPSLHQVIDGEEVAFGANYVFAERKVSEEAGAVIESELAQEFGEILDPAKRYPLPQLLFRAGGRYGYETATPGELVAVIAEARAAKEFNTGEKSKAERIITPAKAQLVLADVKTPQATAGGVGEAGSLQITHTRAEGTLIEGTTRGDGAAEILKSNRWRWSRNLGCWYVPHSRDKAFKNDPVRQTAAELETAGFAVSIAIDDTARPASVVEQAKADQAAARADALLAKAERKAAAALTAQERANAAYNDLPEDGEPIKVGHHSEHRHRRAIEKAHRTTGQAIAAGQDAEYAAERAAIAAAATDRRNAPVTVANRIKTLSAQLRGIQREITGYSRTLSTYSDGTKDIYTAQPATGKRADRLKDQAAETEDQIKHWEAVRAAQIASGLVNEFSAANISKGGYIYYVGSWHKVLKTNKTSVTIEWFVGTYLVPYEHIKAHRTVEQVRED